MNNNRRDRDENGNPRFRLSLEEQIIISERRRRREAIEAERERREMASVKPIVMDKKNKVRFGFIAAAAKLIPVPTTGTTPAGTGTTA